jgi:DNA end-binding protein Ku
MLALAEHILESKAATFDPTLFHDRYEEAIVAMLNEKRAGMPIPKERPMPRIVAGTDLMAALRQSIDKVKEETPKTAAKPAEPAALTVAAKPAAAAKGKRNTKGSSDQREMLLPISGGVPAKEAGSPAKEAAEKQTAQKPGARKKAG